MGYGVSSRLGWLGIAREPFPGRATMPTAAIPVNLDAYEPEDTPQVLLDAGLRATMGGVAGAVLGEVQSVFSFGAPLFPDSGGFWLDNLLGDLSTTSGGTLGAAQALSLALNVGDTQLTVSASLGAVVAGSVIQISDGAASEIVIATVGSSGTTVRFTGTPCRFAHAVTATAALQTAGNGYSHAFSVLSSGSGQPPTHCLTDTTGLTAGTGARAYPGACVTQIDLAGDPGSGFITGKVSGVAWPSRPSAATPSFPAVVTVPLPGWRAAVYVNGVVANAGPWTLSMQRQTVVYRTAQGGQDPVVIARGGLTVTGMLTYPDPADETPLSQLLSGAQVPLRIAAGNGLSGASALSLTVLASQAQFTKAKVGRSTPAVSYADTWQAIDNATDAGGSGGKSPIQAVLANNQAAY